jgi:hypothetical protein
VQVDDSFASTASFAIENSVRKIARKEISPMRWLLMAMMYFCLVKEKRALYQ